MKHKKEFFLFFLAQAAIIAVFTVLCIRAPLCVSRTFSIITAPGQYRLCYYVPGEILSVTGSREDLIQSVTWEPFGNGTLLQAELEKTSNYSSSEDSLSILFKARGTRMQPQEALTEDLDAVRWTREYSSEVWADLDEGYLLTSTASQSSFTGWPWTENTWSFDLKIRYGSFAFFSLVCFLIFMGVHALSGAIKRKKGKKYRGLKETLMNYLNGHWRMEEHRSSARWIQKKMRRRRAFDYIRILLLGLLVGWWFLEMYRERLDLSGLIVQAAALILACWAAVIVWELLAIRSINKLAEKDPMAAFWCAYQRRFDQFIELNWSLLDMNFAAYMRRNGTSRDSAQFADALWNLLGQKCRGGVYYLQYHYTQYRNYQVLEQEETAAMHLKLVKKELPRRKKNAFYQDIKRRLEEEARLD